MCGLLKKIPYIWLKKPAEREIYFFFTVNSFLDLYLMRQRNNFHNERDGKMKEKIPADREEKGNNFLLRKLLYTVFVMLFLSVILYLFSDRIAFTLGISDLLMRKAAVYAGSVFAAAYIAIRILTLIYKRNDK